MCLLAGGYVYSLVGVSSPQEKEAKEQMKRKAKEIQMAKKEQQRSGGGGGRYGGIGECCGRGLLTSVCWCTYVPHTPGGGVGGGIGSSSTMGPPEPGYKAEPVSYKSRCVRACEYSLCCLRILCMW